MQKQLGCSTSTLVVHVSSLFINRINQLEAPHYVLYFLYLNWFHDHLCGTSSPDLWFQHIISHHHFLSVDPPFVRHNRAQASYFWLRSQRLAGTRSLIKVRLRRGDMRKLKLLVQDMQSQQDEPSAPWKLAILGLKMGVPLGRYGEFAEKDHWQDGIGMDRVLSPFWITVVTVVTILI